MIGFMMMLNVKAKIQYGKTLLYEIISYLIRYPVEFAAAWILLYNFNNLGGWDFYQILFLQAISFVVISISCAFTWEPMMDMESFVVEGKLDQYLIAPINPFWYVIGMDFRATNLFITLICGSIAVYTAHLAGVMLSIKVLFYLFGLVGAIILAAAFNVFIGASTFWFFQTNRVLCFMIDTVGEFLKYPFSIYSAGLRFGLTVLLPISLMNYYPVYYLFEKGDVGELHMMGILLVGGLFFYLAYQLWFLGLKKYKSAGG